MTRTELVEAVVELADKLADLKEPCRQHREVTLLFAVEGARHALNQALEERADDKA